MCEKKKRRKDMAEAKRERKKFITPVGRIAFASLFVKARPMEGAVTEPMYEATIVFDKNYLSKNSREKELLGAIRKEMEACCVEKFKKSIHDSKARIDKFHDPFRDGAQKEHLEGFGEGTMFFKAKSKRRPGVIDTAKNIVEDPEAVYSGCYVRLNVTPFAYDKGGGKGISIALNSVMFVRDGERLDGMSNAEEDFGELPAEQKTDDDDDYL